MQKISINWVSCLSKPALSREFFFEKFFKKVLTFSEIIYIIIIERRKKGRNEKMIIEILNKNEKVKQLMKAAQKAAIKQGITEQEWQQWKKELLYLAIAICPEARKHLADEVYFLIKKGGCKNENRVSV